MDLLHGKSELSEDQIMSNWIDIQQAIEYEQDQIIVVEPEETTKPKDERPSHETKTLDDLDIATWSSIVPAEDDKNVEPEETREWVTDKKTMPIVSDLQGSAEEG